MSGDFEPCAGQQNSLLRARNRRSCALRTVQKTAVLLGERQAISSRDSQPKGLARARSPWTNDAERPRCGQTGKPSDYLTRTSFRRALFGRILILDSPQTFPEHIPGFRITAGNLLRPTRPLIEVYESRAFQTSTPSSGSQQHCIVIPPSKKWTRKAHSCGKSGSTSRLRTSRR